MSFRLSLVPIKGGQLVFKEGWNHENLREPHMSCFSFLSDECVFPWPYLWNRQFPSLCNVVASWNSLFSWSALAFKLSFWLHTCVNLWLSTTKFYPFDFKLALLKCTRLRASFFFIFFYLYPFCSEMLSFLNIYIYKY